MVQVEVVAFEREQQAIRSIRERVFIAEQQVPPELEWDGLDPRCQQVLARSAAGEAVGTGRLTPDGHIGRMAVLAPWRGQGVGSQLLCALVELARAQGRSRVVLNAQTHAIPFYERHGFTVTGEVFLDAGIPHRAMVREL